MQVIIGSTPTRRRTPRSPSEPTKLTQEGPAPNPSHTRRHGRNRSRADLAIEAPTHGYLLRSSSSPLRACHQRAATLASARSWRRSTTKHPNTPDRSPSPLSAHRLTRAQPSSQRVLRCCQAQHPHRQPAHPLVCRTEANSHCASGVVSDASRQVKQDRRIGVESPGRNRSFSNSTPTSRFADLVLPPSLVAGTRR